MAEEEEQRLARALQEAKPAWWKDGLGIRGPQPTTTRSSGPPDVALGSVKREPPQPFFPADEPGATGPAAEVPADAAYSFQLSVDSVLATGLAVKIHVAYGEIKDTPPDGMTGADDYILTIALDGTEIYAVITYDTPTLEITSRSLAYGEAVPDSTLGTLYVPIGFVDIEFNPGTGKIASVFPHNRQCGDIEFDLIYGDMNGAPALFAVRTFGIPVPIT